MYKLLLMLLAAGCLESDFLGSPLAGSDVDMARPPSSPPQNPGCTPGAPPDIATLTPCCNGAAHCVPSLPASVAAQLEACPSGGACVPDTLIRSSGGKPPSCKSLDMAEGVCLSVCVPTVAQYQSILPQDSCADDERCAPCISPLDNLPTGACDIGSVPITIDSCEPAPAPSSPPAPSTPPAPPMCPHTGPQVIDPATLPACGGGAHCLSAALVPAAMASRLAACATGLCVPDPFIAAGGNFIPPSCTSVAGAEGRCLNVVLPEVAKQAATLPQDSCTVNEKCVPCYTPLDGADTGACRLSCDPGPQKPKVVFTSCCEMDNATYGKCVPTTSIPEAQQENLDGDVCLDTQLCVPTEMLQPTFKPPACSANNFLVGDYTGVCLSECLRFGIQGLAISRGTCDDLHKCAPCINPLTGDPTGAPGCPP